MLSNICLNHEGKSHWKRLSCNSKIYKFVISNLVFGNHVKSYHLFFSMWSINVMVSEVADVCTNASPERSSQHGFFDREHDRLHTFNLTNKVKTDDRKISNQYEERMVQTDASSWANGFAYGIWCYSLNMNQIQYRSFNAVTKIVLWVGFLIVDNVKSIRWMVATVHIWNLDKTFWTTDFETLEVLVYR